MSARLDHRRIVRRALKAERGLKGYAPEPRHHYTADPPPAPKNADEVLAAIAGRYPPGCCIGLQQVIECISITWEQASEIRRWALQVGAWPWLRPGIGRKVGQPEEPRGSSRRRKPGGGQ